MKLQSGVTAASLSKSSTETNRTSTDIATAVVVDAVPLQVLERCVFKWYGWF